jgi:hypothetical protein
LSGGRLDTQERSGGYGVLQEITSVHGNAPMHLGPVREQSEQTAHGQAG